MMRILLTCGLLLCGSVALNAQDKGAEKPTINFTDHVLPIFRQHCLKCHNANDAEAGLAIDTYAGLMEGGGSGDAVTDGDSSGSRLYLVMTHEEEPTMPPNQDPLPTEQLEIIRQWIDGGLLENSGSKRKKRKGPSLSFSATDSSGKPAEIAMPESVWRVPVVTPQRHAAASAIATSPWAPMVAIAGQKQVSLYHTDTNDLLGVIPYPEGIPQALRFSGDGAYLLVAGGTHAAMGTASLYDVRSGKRLVSVGDELDVVFGADINDDLSKIAMGGPQRIVRVLDTASGEVLHELKKHTDWVYSVAYSPDGVLVASGDRSGGLHVWEADTGRLYLDLIGHKDAIRGLSWRADSNVLVSASEDGTIKLWEMNSGNQLKSITAHSGGATGVQMARDGRMVTCGKDRTVKLWDASGKNIATMPAFAEPALEAALTHDGKKIIGGDWAGKTVMWTIEDPKQAINFAADPPTLEQQLAAMTSRTADLNEALTGAMGGQTNAQKAVDGLTASAESYVAQVNQNKTAQTKSKSDLAAAEKQLVAYQQQREAAMKTLAANRQTVEQLAKQIEAATKTITAQKQQLNTSVAKRDAAKKQLSVVATELAMSQKQHEQLKADAVSSLAAIVDRELDLAAKEQVAATDEAEAEEKRKQAETLANQLTQEIANLNAKIKQSTEQINASKTELAAVEALVAKLPGEIQTAKQQLDAKSSEAETVQKQITAEADKAKKKALTEKLSQTQAQIASAKTVHTDLTKTLAEATSKKAATVKTVEGETALVTSLAKQKPPKITQLEAAQKSMANWLTSRDQAAKKKAAFAQQLALVTGEVTAITKLKDDAVKKIAILVKQQEALQQQQVANNKAVALHEAARVAAESKLTDLTKTVQSNTPKFETAKATVTKLTSEVANLDAKLKAQPTAIASQKKIIDGFTATNAKLDKQIAENKQQMEQAIAKLAETKAAAESARIKMVTAQTKMQQLQNEINAFAEFGQKLTAAAKATKVDAEAKRSAVEPETTRAADMATAMSKREQQLGEVSQTLAKLQAQLEALTKAQTADQQSLTTTQAKIQALEAAADESESIAEEKRAEAEFFQSAYGN
ncbi:MAG: hypothetical protein P8L85_06580 [Rubripirellula sp.]|nr:hypothetical protein [Rubripirellula sp.]